MWVGADAHLILVGVVGMNVVEYLKGLPERMAKDLENIIDKLDTLRWELGLTDRDIGRIIIWVVGVGFMTVIGVSNGLGFFDALLISALFLGCIALFDWIGGFDYVEP